MRDGSYKLKAGVTVYKKVYRDITQHFVATLYLPKGTRVVCTTKGISLNLTGTWHHSKCRASRAKVVALRAVTPAKPIAFFSSETIPGTDAPTRLRMAFSKRAQYERGRRVRFKYKIGENVKPDEFDPSPSKQCTHGIHFFRTFEEARDYRE